MHDFNNYVKMPSEILIFTGIYKLFLNIRLKNQNRMINNLITILI